MTRVDADRTSVGRQLGHIEDSQSVGREDCVAHREREVGEVLVEDLIELVRK